MSINKNIIHLFLAAFCLYFGACNISRLNKIEGNKLVKNKIEIAEKNKSRFYNSDLQGLIKQKPGVKFLGLIRLNVFFYRLGDATKSDNKLKRFLRENLGKVPVIIDTSMIEVSVRAMKNYLKSRGYYYANINYTVDDVLFLKYKKVVTYHVQLGNQYFYNQLHINCPNKAIFDLVYANINETEIHVGRSFRREDLLNEQNRILNLLRNNGYYTFAKEFIDYNLDTNFLDNGVSVEINIKNSEDLTPFEKFYIRNLTIEVEPSAKKEFASKDTQLYGNIKYIENGSNINFGILQKMNFLIEGDYFQQKNLMKTYSRLSDLQIFKLVTITPNLILTDSLNYIDFYINLKQQKKYDASIEPQAITSDQANLVDISSFRNYGLAAVLQLTNRNIFHNAEILQLRFRSSFEAQRGDGIPAVPFFNSFEQSFTTSITIPQLLFFNKLDRKINNANTKTIINSSVIYEKNVQYERRVFTIGSSYQINRKLISYFVAFPEFSFIKTDFTNQELEARSKTDIFLQNVFANNLIVNDIRLGFTYNNQPESKGKSYTFLRFDALELAGNLVSLFNIALNEPKVTESSKNIVDKYELFGLNYFQYVKSFADFRYNHWLDVNNTMVYRVAVGYALPYGNSPQFIPFEKRFFTGGANSIRAFSPRTIGPGSYVSDNLIDRSGDIKLELNTEFRFNIYKHFFEGALFTDAGNVWAVRKDERENAHFDFSTFYKELAIGSGVGIRANLSIFIFRLDAAFPLHDPFLEPSKRWVIKNADNATWFWDNSIFNFGIGYPF